MATAARNSTKADGDVIGGRTAQANGKPGDCGACVDRGSELFANRDSCSQCSAVQCSAVPCGAVAAAMPRALWEAKGEKEFGALCCGWGALRCTRENPTDPCVHADSLA